MYMHVSSFLKENPWTKVCLRKRRMLKKGRILLKQLKMWDWLIQHVIDMCTSVALLAVQLVWWGGGGAGLTAGRSLQGLLHQPEALPVPVWSDDQWRDCCSGLHGRHEGEAWVCVHQDTGTSWGLWTACTGRGDTQTHQYMYVHVQWNLQIVLYFWTSSFVHYLAVSFIGRWN